MNLTKSELLMLKGTGHEFLYYEIKRYFPECKIESVVLDSDSIR